MTDLDNVITICDNDEIDAFMHEENDELILTSLKKGDKYLKIWTMEIVITVHRKRTRTPYYLSKTRRCQHLLKLMSKLHTKERQIRCGIDKLYKDTQKLSSVSMPQPVYMA